MNESTLSSSPLTFPPASPQFQHQHSFVVQISNLITQRLLVNANRFEAYVAGSITGILSSTNFATVTTPITTH